MLSPMTLKNGLSSVRSETPMVPFVAGFASPGAPESAGLLHAVRRPKAQARMARREDFMIGDFIVEGWAAGVEPRRRAENDGRSCFMARWISRRSRTGALASSPGPHANG